LKKPEKSINGTITIGTATATDLGSLITLPISNPSELPLKLDKSKIK
jgi:hypothetical protein